MRPSRFAFGRAFFRRAASSVLAVSLLLQGAGADAATWFANGPAGAGTAESSASLTLNVAASRTVMRGAFLRAAIGTLRIKLEKGGDIPSAVVPASMLPYARTAQKYGALDAFKTAGKRIDFNRKVTRGEALEVLAALAKQTPRKAVDRTFTDVKTGAAKNAAAVAIDRGWMRPYRTTFFGWARPLTLAEEKALLGKVTQSAGVIVLPPEPQTITVPLGGSSLPKEDVMDTVWDLLQRDYLYKEKIKADEAGFKSVEGLVNSLNDPYTVFYRPSSTQDFQTQLKGEVTGIGAQVEQKDGVLVIVAPVTGSPAERAGLQPGDEILSVNGETLAGLPYNDAVNRVRGPKGSVANLHLRRNGMELDVAVERDVVKISDIDVAFQGDIAVVTLRQFGQTADSDFRRIMTEVAARQPRGLVLDLRNNPGGLLNAAGVVAGAFLPSKATYVKIQTPKETTEEKTREAPVFDASLKVAVIVNRGSASAAEIVAGALQDARRATIIGEKTFGKGTVQQLVEFRDGSSLKMTIAEWLTPNGNKIDGIGVQPDVVVAAVPGSDVQLARALDLLR